MNTAKLAESLGIRPQSIHHRTCVTGSYFGLRPQVLPNGRLLWPDDAVEQLIAQRKTKQQEADHAAA